MLLRGMHDTGCDEIFIIVTDLKRQEMDDVTEYFKLACRYTFGQTCKPSMERRIQGERQFPPFFHPMLTKITSPRQTCVSHTPSSANIVPPAFPR